MSFNHKIFIGIFLLCLGSILIGVGFVYGTTFILDWLYGHVGQPWNLIILYGTLSVGVGLGFAITIKK